MAREIFHPYERVVWHLTEQLAETADISALARLQTVTARLLAKQSKTVSLSRYKARGLTAGNQAQLDRMQAMKDAVANGLSQSNGDVTAYPERVAIWPLDDNEKAVGSLPKGSGWFGKESPTHVFRSRSGEIKFGYFESSEPPDEGVARVVMHSQIPVAQTMPVKSSWAWMVGVAAVVLFIFAMGSAFGTGHLLGKTYDVIRLAQNDPEDRLSTALVQLCEGQGAGAQSGLCVKDGDIGDALAECTSEMIVETPLDDDEKLVFQNRCHIVWETALHLADASDFQPKGGFGAALHGVTEFITGAFTFGRFRAETIAQNLTVSISPFYLMSVAALVLLFAALGLGTSGRPSGVFVSPQNRVSLSRIQVTAWTTVLLSGFATYAAFNIGVVGAQWLDVFGEAEPSSDDTLFPKLASWTWAVLGIAVASPLASGLIKGQKSNLSESEIQEVQAAETQHAFRLGALSVNAFPGQATIADIFFGEDTFNFTRVDISRTQLVIITLILLYTYASWLIMSMGNITRVQILEAFPRAQPVLETFPNPGPTYVGLLALTHGAYIFGKLQDGKPVDE